MSDKKVMSEEIMCQGCDYEVAFFKLTYKDYDGDPEVYCADCTSNIIRETPEDVLSVERI